MPTISPYMTAEERQVVNDNRPGSRRPRTWRDAGREWLTILAVLGLCGGAAYWLIDFLFALSLGGQP